MAYADGVFAEVDGNDAIKQRVPEDVLSRYKYAMRHLMQPLYRSQPIGQVTDAVVQALFRPVPPTRLLVGWDGLLTFLLEWMPEQYLDRIVGKSFLRASGAGCGQCG